MNATRNRTKKQNGLLQHSLDMAEWKLKRERERKAMHGKLSDILLGLGNLVFGGMVIGSIFQDTELSVLICITGVLASGLLLCLGFMYYVKSIKEK